MPQSWRRRLWRRRWTDSRTLQLPVRSAVRVCVRCGGSYRDGRMDTPAPPCKIRRMRARRISQGGLETPRDSRTVSAVLCQIRPTSYALPAGFAIHTQGNGVCAGLPVPPFCINSIVSPRSLPEWAALCKRHAMCIHCGSYSEGFRCTHSPLCTTRQITTQYVAYRRGHRKRLPHAAPVNPRRVRVWQAASGGSHGTHPHPSV